MGEGAKENYRQIALYLLDAFGFPVAERFTDTINEKLRILDQMPFIGRQPDPLTSVRKLPVQPHNVIYSTIVERPVIILNIPDGRRKNAP